MAPHESVVLVLMTGAGLHSEEIKERPGQRRLGETGHWQRVLREATATQLTATEYLAGDCFAKYMRPRRVSRRDSGPVTSGRASAVTLVARTAVSMDRSGGKNCGVGGRSLVAATPGGSQKALEKGSEKWRRPVVAATMRSMAATALPSSVRTCASKDLRFTGADHEEQALYQTYSRCMTNLSKCLRLCIFAS